MNLHVWCVGILIGVAVAGCGSGSSSSDGGGATSAGGSGAAGASGSGGSSAGGSGGSAGSAGSGAAGSGGSGGAGTVGGGGSGAGGSGGSGASGATGGKGALCDACTSDASCADHLCLGYLNYPDAGAFCAPDKVCSTSADCPSGWDCSAGECWVTTAWGCSGNSQTLTDNCGRVLLTTPCGAGETCTRDGVCAVPAGNLDYCAACTSGSDCASGRCLGYANHPELGYFCAPPETPCAGGAACPAGGWECNSDINACRVTTAWSCNGNNKVLKDNCGRVLSSTPCGNGQSCTGAGTCVGGSPLCAACNSGSDCASGYCGALQSHPEYGNFCYPGGVSPCSQCPSGWACGSSTTCWVTSKSICTGTGYVQQDNCGHVLSQSSGTCKKCSSDYDCPGDCSGTCCPYCKTYSDGSTGCSMTCF